MVLEKIVKQLQNYLDKGEKKKRVSCGAVDELLKQLQEKKKKIEKKLDKESSGSRRKHLKLELKILSAELKRGQRRRNELKKLCK